MLAFQWEFVKKRVYPLGFRPFRGIGKTRPRQMLVVVLVLVVSCGGGGFGAAIVGVRDIAGNVLCWSCC